MNTMFMSWMFCTCNFCRWMNISEVDSALIFQNICTRESSFMRKLYISRSTFYFHSRYYSSITVIWYRRAYLQLKHTYFKSVPGDILIRYAQVGYMHGAPSPSLHSYPMLIHTYPVYAPTSPQLLWIVDMSLYLYLQILPGNNDPPSIYPLST